MSLHSFRVSLHYYQVILLQGEPSQHPGEHTPLEEEHSQLHSEHPVLQVEATLFQGKTTYSALGESILFTGKGSRNFSKTFRYIPCVFLKMPKKLKMSHFSH